MEARLSTGPTGWYVVDQSSGDEQVSVFGPFTEYEDAKREGVAMFGEPSGQSAVD